MSHSAAVVLVRGGGARRGFDIFKFHHLLPIVFSGSDDLVICIKAFFFVTALHGPSGRPVDRTIIHPGFPVKTSVRHPKLLGP